MSRSGSRKQAPRPHPDWFWSLSGGIDSTAAFLLTRDALHDNYHKRPVAVYFETRIGTPLTRLFLEELTRVYGDQLVAWYTEEDFREFVVENDAPGGGMHSSVRDLLKGRQASKLTTLADKPVHVLGLRAGESQPRAHLPKVVEKARHVEVYPVHRLSKPACARIILEHEDCPINPLWIWPEVIADCGCLANGDPSELDRTAERFPWFAHRLREYEEAIEADGLRGTLGWDGLTAVEKSAIAHGHEQLTLCGDGCQRRRDPAVVRAFRAVIHGATRDEAIGLLRAFRADEWGQRGTRRHALLELAWSIGARLGGLRALDVRDLDREGCWVRFVHRPETDTPLKNGPDGERYVGLPEAVVDAVGAYLDSDDRYRRVDDHGRRPLLNGLRGRPTTGTIREWIYLATVPCWYRDCPHGLDPDSCEYREYHAASGCPSSRSPHMVRTGAITWMLSQGIPVERVAERVNATVEVIQRHYDKLNEREEFERRRRQWVDQLTIDATSDTQHDDNS